MLRTLETSALLLVAGALFLGAAPACGAAETRPTVSDMAVLEVVNRTDRPQEIFLDGQRVGRVGSAERRRFRALSPGEVRLSAQPPEGGLTAARVARLAVDFPFVWTLGDEAADAPAVPRLGDLAVRNALGRDVEVATAERRLGMVFAGQERVFRDLPEGPTSMEASSVEDERRVRDRFVIAPDATTQWVVTAPMGSLAVRNAWREPVEVTLDDRAVGTIPAGETEVFEHRFEGPVTANARGLRTGTVARAQVEIVAGERTDWSLSEGAGAVSLENRAAEPLAVGVDGGVVGILPPGERLVVHGLMPGEHRLEVGGTDSGLRFARDVRLGSGERAHWTVDPRFGTLRVHNATPEAQHVYLDDEYVQTLAPGARADLGDVGVGRHEVSAVGARSNLRQREPFVASPAEGETWRIEGGASRLAVVNHHDEALRIYVDARLRGLVQPDQTLTIEPVVVGGRLFEAVGDQTGRVFRERATVPPDGTYVWAVREADATLVVENRSGEDLRTGPDLAGQLARLRGGEHFAFEVPAGARRVVLLGARTGFRYSLETTIEEGASRTWVVPPPKGALVVHNRSGEPLELTLDGAPVRTLPAGEDLLLDGVPAGRHVVQARGQTTGAALRWPVALTANDRAAWEVAPQLARVRVRNTTDEPLELAIDGDPFGRVEPGGILQLGRLRPGRHELRARGLTTGIRYDTSLEARVGHAAVWEVLPARGAVVVRSSSDVPQQVFVDGERVGEIEGPDRPLLVEAPGGERVLDVVPADGRGEFRARLRVAPDRTAEIRVPAAAVPLEIDNRTAQTARVYRGDRLLGEVPADGRATVELPAGERVELRAVSEDGGAVWSRTTWTELGEDAERAPEIWTLSAPREG